MVYANDNLDNIVNVKIGNDISAYDDGNEVWRIQKNKGITRSQYEGKAYVFQDPEPCNPDYVAIAFPPLPDNNYVIQLTGGYARWEVEQEPPWEPNRVDIYADWYVVEINANADGFIAYPTYTVYSQRREPDCTPDPLIYTQIYSLNKN